jgi:hypothetical protein
MSGYHLGQSSGKLGLNPLRTAAHRQALLKPRPKFLLSNLAQDITTAKLYLEKASTNHQKIFRVE